MPSAEVAPLRIDLGGLRYLATIRLRFTLARGLVAWEPATGQLMVIDPRDPALAYGMGLCDTADEAREEASRRWAAAEWELAFLVPSA